MAEIKWIKLNIDMFDNRKIKQIRKLPGGNDMVLFWVMLLTLAGRSNSQGYILFTESIPYTPEMLASECDFELNTVKMALEIFEKFDMITLKEEIISIAGWTEHQNVEGMDKIREQTKKRVQAHREKKKALLESAKEETCGGCYSNDTCNVTVTLSNAIEVEGDIDIEVDSNTTTPTNDNQEVSSDYKLFFDNNMGHLITPFELQTLISYEEDGMEPAVITLALQQSVEANVRDIRYVKKILDRWLANKITTVKAVLLDRKNFQSKKNSDSKSTTGKDNKSNKKQHQSGKGLRFTDYEQREYDYNALEKKLLGWDDQ